MNILKLITTLGSALGLMTVLLLGSGNAYAASSDTFDALTSPGILLQSDSGTTEEEGGEKKKTEDEEEPDC